MKKTLYKHIFLCYYIDNDNHYYIRRTKNALQAQS